MGDAVCRDGICESSDKNNTPFLNPQNLLQKEVQTITSKKGFKAPQFSGLENWINSEPIDSLESLKGQVVAVKFWTFSCINCIATLDETQALYEKYKDQGFTIIAVHSPEFAYEKNLPEVQAAVDKYGLTFPVVQDNDFKTWRAYNNRYWPAFYLIDKEGNIRYTHFGEGKYDEKDQAVQELLGEGQQPQEQLFISDNLKTDTSKTSIETNLILDGGPGKDGIPSINNPEFLSQTQAESAMPYLRKDSQGIVVQRGEEARYYSYDVLVWHEIVNDEIDGEKIAVTFCPLCGSAIVYDRNINGREVNFGVSGKLYNSNLLMYDSYDETLWSQSLGEAVTGGQLGTKLSVVKSQLMSYQEFVDNFPNGVVLSDDTGYGRNYGQIPYGNYNQSDDLYFPVENSLDTSFQSKTLFYIINHNDVSVAFHWDDLRASGSAKIQVDDNLYTATFKNGLADVVLDGEVLPGYFEMWFSWRSHNTNNPHIWSLLKN